MSSLDAAGENCADLELEYRKCNYNGKIWERIKGCYEEDARWRKCISQQKVFLDKLGFEDKRRSGEELEWIVEEADRRWLVEKREEEAKGKT